MGDATGGEGGGAEARGAGPTFGQEVGGANSKE